MLEGQPDCSELQDIDGEIGFLLAMFFDCQGLEDSFPA